MIHANNSIGRYQKYLIFFRMRFIAGLQYRAAAMAGIITQFAWGTLLILMYKAFYEANPEKFPMSFQALSSYIWLQQSLLALFMAWFFENDIFQAITEGGVAYELCRPVNLYFMWFFRSMAGRLSKTVLRCMPILIVAAFLPYPYGIQLPENINAACWFIVTLLFGFVVMIAFCMLIYISAFFTYSPMGIKLLAATLADFLSGSVIPLPFLPKGFRKVIELLPFASMQNVPLRIYSGDITGTVIYWSAGLQLFWAVVLIWIGKRITDIALKRVVVQGG